MPSATAIGTVTRNAIVDVSLIQMDLSHQSIGVASEQLNETARSGNICGVSTER